MRYHQLKFVIPLITFVIIAIISVIPVQTQNFVAQQDCASRDDLWIRDRDAEEEVLSRINQWRFREDLYPLARNELLDVIAGQQADYIKVNVPFLTLQDADFHTDRFGTGISRRLQRNGWPTYENGMILGSEIAAYYPTLAGVVGFWQTSPPHSASVQTNGYREAGVFVFCRRNWYLAYVVLAGRPDILPVTYDPASHALFLTRDESWYSDDFIPAFVQITDRNGIRLHQDEWIVWSDLMQLPQNAPNQIVVNVTDGIREIRTNVNLYQARVFPSEATPTPSSTPIPEPTATASPILPTSLPPTLTPSPTPLPRDTNFDVEIVYNRDQLTIINGSGHTIDLSPLVVRSTFPIRERTASWLGQYYAGDMSLFPNGYCLQAYSREMFSGPATVPSLCRRVVSTRSSLEPGERFWIGRTFEVLYRRELIASCPGINVGDGRVTCGFDLPE